MNSAKITFLDSNKSYTLSGENLKKFQSMSVGLEDKILVEVLS